MRILIAMDSFKGSLSSMQAGNAVKEAALKIDPDAEVTVCPVADGGEGTLEALHTFCGGRLVKLCVKGPMHDAINAEYCILNDGTAVIEAASAIGLTLVPKEKREPEKATDFGVGELIKDAVLKGCRDFIVGIGGSATNDGGVGMLGALGFEFLDKDGISLSPDLKGLEYLDSVSAENALPGLSECTFRIACDVKNPLCGKDGCSSVFGPQKGASEESIKHMDALLSKYADAVEKSYPRADRNFPGAGAAGGLGFAFLSFMNSKLESGIKLVAEKTELEEHIKNADLIVTGEGRLDAQTMLGKAPFGIAQAAAKYKKKVIAFAGCVTDDARLCNENGITAYFPTVRGITTHEEAMKPENARRALTDTAEQVFRLIMRN